jgi:hypothetical protein
MRLSDPSVYHRPAISSSDILRIAIITPLSFPVTPLDSSRPDAIDSRPTEFLLALQRSRHTFTLSTESNSYQVSADLIDHISAAVASARRRDPSITSFHLSIEDPNDVFGKLIRVFNGGSVAIHKPDRKVVKTIVRTLRCFPGVFPPVLTPQLLPEPRWRDREPPVYPDSFSIEIDVSSLTSLLVRIPRPFIIRTDVQDYYLNLIGIHLSTVLASCEPDGVYVAQIPDIGRAFRDVCDYLNSEACRARTGEQTAFLQIAEALGLGAIGRRVEAQESEWRRRQMVMDRLDEFASFTLTVQDLLFKLTAQNLAETTVAISQAEWFADPDRMREFASNFLLAAKVRPRQQGVLADLVLGLQNAGHADFVLYLSRRLVFQFEKSAVFIFDLYERGVMKLDDIVRAGCALVHRNREAPIYASGHQVESRLE